MPSRLSRTTPSLGHLLAGLCLVLVAWLGSLPARAEDILLTGAEDSPGMQAFATALGELRPAQPRHEAATQYAAGIFHAAIHLHGVDRHDVGASCASHRHGNVALAACRWCNDGNLLHE